MYGSLPIRTHMLALRLAEEAIQARHHDYLRLLEQHGLIDTWLGKTFGDTFWQCPKNITGWCLYDNFKDRAHDSCVFCGEPEERK